MNTPVFITVLFTIAKMWEKSKCLWTDEWIKKTCYIHTVGHHSALKKKMDEPRGHYAKLNEPGTEGQIQLINPLLWDIGNSKTHRNREYKDSSLQSLSRIRLFATPWCSTSGIPVHLQLPEFTQTHVHRVGRLISSNHLICRPLLLLPPIPPSIRVVSNESTLHIRWPKYWSFTFSISPSNEHPGLISF